MWHDLALSISKMSDFPRIKIGALIVKNGGLVCVGFNRKKSHPVQKKYNIHRGFDSEPKDYIHAEISAIVKAKNVDLRGSSIYISRNNVNGDMAMCRPCKACMEAIRESGISKVFYMSELGYERLTFA